MYIQADILRDNLSSYLLKQYKLLKANKIILSRQGYITKA